MTLLVRVRARTHVCAHAGLHFAMFIPAVAAQVRGEGGGKFTPETEITPPGGGADGQGTPEQIAEWMPRALAPCIIGCFAQTELAHGSKK